MKRIFQNNHPIEIKMPLRGLGTESSRTAAAGEAQSRSQKRAVQKIHTAHTKTFRTHLQGKKTKNIYLCVF